MIVYDIVMNVLDTKSFPQHNIASLISGITFIVLFQSGEASTVEENKHTHSNEVNWGLSVVVRVIFKPLSNIYDELFFRK